MATGDGCSLLFYLSAIDDHASLLLISHVAAVLSHVRFTRLKHVNGGEMRSYGLKKSDGHGCNHADRSATPVNGLFHIALEV
jgi:hypothetical protein